MLSARAVSMTTVMGVITLCTLLTPALGQAPPRDVELSDADHFRILQVADLPDLTVVDDHIKGAVAQLFGGDPPPLTYWREERVLVLRGPASAVDSLAQALEKLGLLEKGAARKAAATSGHISEYGLDQILVALGILLLLAQITERVMEVLKNKKWPPGLGDKNPKPSSKGSPRRPNEQAERTLRLNAWSVPVGVLIAVAWGTDVIHLAATGEVASIWSQYAWDFWEPWHWIRRVTGVVLTGLVASMGSGFLHDLISVVRALKEGKQSVVEKKGTGANGGGGGPGGGTAAGGQGGGESGEPAGECAGEQ